VTPLTFAAPEKLLTRVVRIDLVGTGGTGSALADQLASLEVTLRQLGHPGFQVSLYDPDRVSPSNLGRQRFTRADVGLPKATVLAHRLNLFYGLTWKPLVAAYDTRGGMPPDLLLTCVDTAEARVAIAARFTQRYESLLWLDLGNGSTIGQAVLGTLGGDGRRDPAGLRLPNVLDLFPELATMQENDTPSCSTAEALRRQALPVNRVAATIALDLLYSLFRFGRLEHHGAQFSVDPLRVTPIPIDPKAWELYGYRRTVPDPVAPARKSRRR